MRCVKCGVSGCSCLFTLESKKTSKPVCKKCAGKAQLEELAEINAIQKEVKMSKPMLIQVGHDNEQYHSVLRKYAGHLGCDYSWLGKWENTGNTLFQKAEKIKNAAMVAIWNGKQGCGPLVAQMCKRRGIPYFFFENGMLPQMHTFFIDPTGFCADSVLNGDLSWVTDEDMDKLYAKRKELQKQYPRDDRDFILATLQIHNDAQILYHSPYRNMDEFVHDVEEAYPDDEIIARPHPKGGNRNPRFERAKTVFQDNFLTWAARAKIVVATTSTCLYEAAVLGVPVRAFGDHPFATHPPEMHDKVAAGALALCIPRKGGEIKQVLDRFGYEVKA